MVLLEQWLNLNGKRRLPWTCRLAEVTPSPGGMSTILNEALAESSGGNYRGGYDMPDRCDDYLHYTEWQYHQNYD